MAMVVMMATRLMIHVAGDDGDGMAMATLTTGRRQ
jgi:hypothetical protein